VTAARRVLVVEDEPAIRDLVALILEEEGFAVETAAQGREGLAKAHRQRPDMVIVDLMMPIMSGWEFLGTWQADSETQHIPIVAMSAAYSVTTAEVVGVQGFLRKPFHVDRLLALVKLVFDERDRPE
jgi:DNA-binding response OmpR family regulator